MLITHEELQDKCRKAMGGEIPREARDRWGDFLRSRGSSFCFAPHWIKDNRIFQWVEANKEFIDISGNGDFFKIEILDT